MTMKVLFKSCLAWALLALTAGALAAPTIELKDGSRIVGEIENLQDGAYTVVSPTMGTLHVAQSDIVRIVYGASPTTERRSSSVDAPARNDALARQALQLQSSMAQDPEVMKSIMSLQSDPQIQALLSDPDIVQAIQQGDYTSLLGNAKIQALENDEQLKKLLQQLQQQ